MSVPRRKHSMPLIFARPSVPARYRPESREETLRLLRYAPDMIAANRHNKTMMRGALLLFALVALALPRLLPAAPLDLLSGQQVASPDHSELANDNFPGSAFFYAQGAFDPVPGAQQTVRTVHVLGLDTVQAAPAAVFRGLTALDDYRALNCLTSAIYYEAGNEPDDGQRAVAQVVLNRVRSQFWPASVCGVVYEGSERADMRCQFTFSCDGSMARMPSAAAWMRAQRVARQALAGSVYAPVGLATHYHTLAVLPGWASSLRPVAVIGAHIFYRMQGSNGTEVGFHSPYARRELISGPAPRVWTPRPAIPADNSYAAPSTGWTPLPAPRPRDTLPESTIRPEYRNTGRPLI